MFTCKGLLAKEPLGLTVQLLDELARQQASLKNLDPSAYAKLHETKLQQVRFLLGPPRRGCEVPPMSQSMHDEVYEHDVVSNDLTCRLPACCWCFVS